jgi:uncharacterized cupredoxin-like copper-binding protein
MKKFFLIIALVLAVVSSLVAGTMAAYTQTLDIGSGNVLTKQFSISAEESKTFTQDVRLAPGDSVTYKVTVCNDSGIKTAVHVDGQLVAVSGSGNTQLALSALCPGDTEAATTGNSAFTLDPGQSSELTFTVSWPYGGDDGKDAQMMESGAASQLKVVITGASVNEGGSVS